MADLPDIHIHLSLTDPEVVQKLDALLQGQRLIEATILEGDIATMADLSQLQAEVEETGNVIDSAVTLIGGMAEKIRELATDPAALQQLADDLDAKQQELAAAVDAVPHPEQQ